MKNNFLKYLMLGCSAMVFLNACVKDKYSPNQAAGQGPSYIRITEAKLNPQFFAVFTNIKAVNMFSVQRDAASNDALQTTNTVVLTDVTADYLSKHSTPYSAMPSSLYTLTPQPGLAATATGLTFTFAPGDFAKNVIFNIDGSKIDLSKQYAVVYAISNTGGLTRKAGLDTIVASVAIKNSYDGVYKYTGSIYRFNADGSAETPTTLGGVLPDGLTISLATTSATTCSYSGLKWITGAGVGGVDVLQLSVDPTTNKVTTTSSSNPYVQNITTQDNYYNPSTKTFYVNIGWFTAAPPASSRQAHLVLVYSGSR
ncbi:hypothetical protein BDD43_1515 [Mucilaginibacter gracilis]|uniref:DUF1735 domain-containing protein n=1 Tax=Mucilaginibacter gracilis TaxID=423350 RepID=A0A495IZV9_9SPHI|nr:hypothetical protein [Mucilaginibacter gracilis]RKR81369.1 hypothetical protein BDD43_1515 [Mucilaginibacter gracilis]